MADAAKPILRATLIVVLASLAYMALQVAGASWFSTGPDRVPILPLTAIFILPMAMWFGLWGALGAFFGATLYELPVSGPFVSAVTAVDNFLVAAIVGGFARAIKLDPALPNLRTWMLYGIGVAIGAAVQSILAGLFFLAMSLRTVEELPVGVAAWWVKVMIAGLVFAPILLRLLTPAVRRLGLYYPDFLSARTSTGSRVPNMSPR